MNKIFIYARPCVNKMTFSAVFFVPFLKYPKIDGNDKKLSRPFWNLASFQPLKATAKAVKMFRKFVGRPAAANFGRKTFTRNRTDTNWSSTTFKGKISAFIVVFKLLCYFSYLLTIRLKQDNFSLNNNTNYTRRHKFITHKNNCCQVFSRSRNDQPMFVNEYEFKEG